jgi:multidrug resistance efflux pump
MRTLCGTLLLAALVGSGHPALAQERQEPLSIRGWIVPVQNIHVSARVPGVIVQLLGEEGQVVKKGDVLAKLDSTPYGLEVKRAQAVLDRAAVRLRDAEAAPSPEQVATATTALKNAEAQVANLREQLEKLRQIEANIEGKRLSTQVEERLRAATAQLQQAQADFNRVKAVPPKGRLEDLKAELALAQADFEKARWNVDNTVIVAPADGTILNRKVAIGETVRPDGVLPGTLFVLADLTRLEVELSIPERDIGRIKAGQKCQVRVDAYPNLVFAGSVARILPVADRARAAIPVRVLLDVAGKDVLLRPEMTAVVRFAVE